jgi:1-acyl-sn-glycerol-3-phosphate acyltransferase
MSDAQRKFGGTSARQAAPAFLDTLREYAVFYFALFVLAILCLGWQPCASLLRVVLSPGAARRTGRAAIRHVWHAYFGMLRALGACRFDLAELDALRDQPAMILAPNHPCLLDALLIASRVPDLCCVMKADLARNVFLGSGARLADYIANDAPLAMIRTAVADLQRGHPLLLFPEGTRTETASINALKGGIASIAIRAQVPVQTLIIETDSAFLGKGWKLFRKPELPVTYRVRLGQRFAPPARAPGALQAFVADLQRYYAGELHRDGSAAAAQEAQGCRSGFESARRAVGSGAERR